MPTLVENDEIDPKSLARDPQIAPGDLDPAHVSASIKSEATEDRLRWEHVSVRGDPKIALAQPACDHRERADLGPLRVADHDLVRGLLAPTELADPIVDRRRAALD